MDGDRGELAEFGKKRNRDYIYMLYYVIYVIIYMIFYPQYMWAQNNKLNSLIQLLLDTYKLEAVEF